MFGFFKSTLLFLKISPDAMELTDLRTEKTVSRTADRSFSRSGLLIAEFSQAVALAKNLLRELNLSNKTSRILVQQTLVADQLAESEKIVLRDLCEEIGAKEVLIVTNNETISNEKAKEILKAN